MVRIASGRKGQSEVCKASSFDPLLVHNPRVAPVRHDRDLAAFALLADPFPQPCDLGERGVVRQVHAIKRHRDRSPALAVPAGHVCARHALSSQVGDGGRRSIVAGLTVERHGLSRFPIFGAIDADRIALGI